MVPTGDNGPTGEKPAPQGSIPPPAHVVPEEAKQGEAALPAIDRLGEPGAANTSPNPSNGSGSPEDSMVVAERTNGAPREVLVPSTPPRDDSPFSPSASGNPNFSKLHLAQTMPGIWVASHELGHYVEVNCELLVVDADETMLQDTLEQLHDGPQARFAKAVLAALNEHGVPVTVSDFTKDEFWNDNFRKFSGLSEEGWLAGLSGCIKIHYGIDVSPADLERQMKLVLQNEREFKDFCSRVTPVPKINELSHAFSGAGTKLALCTTTRQDIIGPFLQHFKLLGDYSALAYNADKKLPDPEHQGKMFFSGEGITRICEQLGVDPKDATMLGDSVSDFGAAAMAGLNCCILRVPKYLIEEHGRDVAVQRMIRQVEQARLDNAETPGFSHDMPVVIVDCYDQMVPALLPYDDDGGPKSWVQVYQGQ